VAVDARWWRPAGQGAAAVIANPAPARPAGDLERYIAEMVDGWPELTGEQRARLAVLLHGEPVRPAPGTRP
jgi:hypothetical protein